MKKMHFRPLVVSKNMSELEEYEASVYYITKSITSKRSKNETDHNIANIA
jgi:hypothetical protein